jgi:hypothetical protein
MVDYQARHVKHLKFEVKTQYFTEMSNNPLTAHPHGQQSKHSAPQKRIQAPTKTEDHKRGLGLSSKGKGSNKIVLVVGVDGL